MAVIVSNGPTSLSTTNGFYRAEAFNLGMFSTTDLALSSTRTIAVTFANAGACQGLILALNCSATTANLKSVVVTLQENVASVWTDRATVTYSAATIANNVTNSHSDGWFVPFTGGTFPYAVTAAAGTWRFQISQTGAESSNWSIRTSDATNPFYVAWCNNAVTFANNDCVICKDVVTIDQSATFKGVLGTGDTTRSVASVICRSVTPAPADVSNLVWQNPPAAAYTLTVDGLVMLGNHSGIRVGTDASPIPLAQAATISFVAATSGTAHFGGFSMPEHSLVTSSFARGASFFFYGNYSSPMTAILAAPAATGQPNIVTTTSTGWSNGDRVAVGGFTSRGVGEATVFTVNTIAGANIGLSSNLGSTARSLNGRVVKLSGYGVIIKAPTTGMDMFPGYMSNFVLRGTACQHVTWDVGRGQSASLLPEESANKSQLSITFSAFELATAFVRAAPVAFSSIQTPESGITIQNNVFANCAMFTHGTLIGADSALFVVDTNVNVRPGAVNGAIASFGAGWAGTFTNNVLEGSNNNFLSLSAVGATVTGNRFWACDGGNGCIFIGTVIDSNLSNNEFENNNVGLRVQALWQGGKADDNVFGGQVANTTDVNFLQNSYVNTSLNSQSGNLVFGLGTSAITGALPGSHLRIADFNNSANDDRGYLRLGNYQRTGPGLADTRVRTAGGYAIRLAPNSAAGLLTWPNLVSDRAVPTGNIQAKTMTITAWVYINDAAFYAGTHTKPTLNVKYDNTTTATAVAAATAGSWQQLAVTFTPTTTYGQIEVWVSGATSAAGAASYFYVDDVQVAYPAGVSVNLGGLDLWAAGTPVWPPIATFPSLGGVLDELLSAHTVPGTLGALLSAPLPVDVKAVNGLTVDGTGTESDPWGPA
jgi:hypothetical protein